MGSSPTLREEDARALLGSFLFRKEDILGGKVVSYPGGYDYFLEKTGARGNARAALTAG